MEKINLAVRKRFIVCKFSRLTWKVKSVGEYLWVSIAEFEGAEHDSETLRYIKRTGILLICI